MELTCLGREGKGEGQGRSRRRRSGPSCHLLQVSGVHFLLECPIDMSMLLHFCPVSTPMKMTVNHKYQEDSNPPERPKRPASSQERNTRGKQLKKDPSDIMHSFMHINDHFSPKHMEAFGNDVRGIYTESCTNTRIVVGHPFLDKEPWYKTPEFDLVDISCIDVVLISNPQGMLGLPFLMAKKEFSGKIYATAVTAKLGQLMMEELVSMHEEYMQSFARSLEIPKIPSWLKPPLFYTLPKSMQKAFVDDNCVSRLNWHKLYSKQDIQACMKKVQCLHYDEERSIYDRVCIKPCSSGFEIGSSNWVIRGARCLSYFSASNLISGHAMGLNVASHISSDVLLFCDLENSSEEKKNSPNVAVDSNKAGEVLEFGMNNTPEHSDELSSVCKATVDAVNSGGSVLLAISVFGQFLELLEGISQALCVSKLEDIPIFFVASIAEELLVYTNTVPEWLCSARQEKLYAGEALFGSVELQRNKRLFPLAWLHSQELVRLWKEPCVVVAMDWSLRMGASVHLLYKWRQDARCLLVLTQGLGNVELALLPFQPIKMKILVYSKAQKLLGSEVAAIIEKLKPELSLLPESMKGEFEPLSNGKPVCSGGNVGLYKNWDVLSIPLPSRIEVKMSMDLARDFNPKQLDSGISLGRMVMNSRQKNGNWILELPERSQIYKSSNSLVSACRHSTFWGSMRIKDLLNAFTERGLHCSETKDKDIGTRSGTSYQHFVTITSPSRALVRVTKDSTLIETDDPIVRQLIVDALKNLLNFI